MSDHYQTCPECRGLGVVPAEGHTTEALTAELDRRLEDGTRRLEAIAARTADE